VKLNTNMSFDGTSLHEISCCGTNKFAVHSNESLVRAVDRINEPGQTKTSIKHRRMAYGVNAFPNSIMTTIALKQFARPATNVMYDGAHVILINEYFFY